LAMTFLGAAAMPTTKECRHNAEICLMLASETEEIYAKMALIELAILPPRNLARSSCFLGHPV
jgi:hypothetical protein